MLLLEHTVCLLHAQQEEKLLQKNLQRINRSSYFYPLTSFTFSFSVLFTFLLPSPPFLFFFFSFPRGDIFRPPLIHFHHLHPGMVGVHVCVREGRLEAGRHGNPSGGNIRESVISRHSHSLPAGWRLKTGMVVLEETAVADVRGPQTHHLYVHVPIGAC